MKKIIVSTSGPLNLGFNHYKTALTDKMLNTIETMIQNFITEFSVNFEAWNIVVDIEIRKTR